jgi:hypothetical protein
LQHHNFFIHQSYEKLIENNIPILVTSIHYTDKNFGVDNSKNKKFDFLYLFKSDTKIYYELIKFIYPKNYNNFEDFYNDAYNLINNNLKKYNKKNKNIII